MFDYKLYGIIDEAKIYGITHKRQDDFDAYYFGNYSIIKDLKYNNTVLCSDIKINQTLSNYELHTLFDHIAKLEKALHSEQFKEFNTLTEEILRYINTESKIIYKKHEMPIINNNTTYSEYLICDKQDNSKYSISYSSPTTLLKHSKEITLFSYVSSSMSAFSTEHLPTQHNIFKFGPILSCALPIQYKPQIQEMITEIQTCSERIQTLEKSVKQQWNEIKELKEFISQLRNNNNKQH